MATVSAVSVSDSLFKACYLALTARGKPKELAIVAVMRAMIVTLNAKGRDNKRWNPKYGA